MQTKPNADNLLFLVSVSDKRNSGEKSSVRVMAPTKQIARQKVRTKYPTKSFKIESLEDVSNQPDYKVLTANSPNELETLLNHWLKFGHLIACNVFNHQYEGRRISRDHAPIMHSNLCLAVYYPGK